MTDGRVGASHLLSFLRIGAPAILIDVPDTGWLTDCGFDTYLPSRYHEGFSAVVEPIPADRLTHRLTLGSVELLDPTREVVGEWAAPASRVWRVVAAPPVPMWVLFFAVSDATEAIEVDGSATDEATFRALVAARRIVGGHIAPTPPSST